MDDWIKDLQHPFRWVKSSQDDCIQNINVIHLRFFFNYQSAVFHVNITVTAAHADLAACSSLKTSSILFWLTIFFSEGQGVFLVAIHWLWRGVVQRLAWTISALGMLQMALRMLNQLKWWRKPRWRLNFGRVAPQHYFLMDFQLHESGVEGWSCGRPKTTAPAPLGT